MVPYTAAFSGSNLDHTPLKSIMFGAANDKENIAPAAGGHLHAVSLRVEKEST